MIKANVILDHSKWKNKIKNPSTYFKKKINKAKHVRNPKTNDRLYKKENYKLHFKIGKILHNILNSN